MYSVRSFRPGPCPGLLVGRRVVTVMSSRGFGSGGKGSQKQEQDVPVEGSGRKVKIQRSKGKQSMRVGPGRSAPQPPPQQQQQMRTAPADADPTQAESLVDKMEFEARLKALKATADEKRAETRAAAPSVLDGPSMYDNPPPLSQTLFPSTNSSSSSPQSASSEESASFGPSQFGLAAASLVLVAVFIISNSGSDLGYAQRRASSAAAGGAATEMGAELRADLESQLATASARLEAAPEDLEALESAAVLHARLGDYSAAEKQLTALTAARPGDADAWRVLAETRGTAGDPGGAAAAYRQAWEAGGRSSLEVLTGLSAALAADGKPQAAVDELRALAAKPEEAAKVGELEVGLLLGKAYAQWRGHVADATAQYDALAAAYPQDFRPPLAKGLLLRREGQEGDAQRYLLQARYLAPAGSKSAVAALSAS